MSTIHDVARHARVSITTVSRVLNGTGRVNAEMAERVRASAHALRYRPSHAARTLRVNRSQIIGLLVTDIGNPFFTTLVRGVEDVVQQHGFSLILCNSDEDEDKERQYVEVLCAEQVAGAIVVPTCERKGTLRTFHEQNISIVTVDRRVTGGDMDAVLVDNVGGAREAVAHLIANDFRHIGIITGPQSATTGRERLEGYRLALQDAGIAPDPGLERCGSFRQESGRALTFDLLEQDGSIDALFTANNSMTLGALEAAGALDRRIPDDIGLVGFDDMPWAALRSVSLTSVMQPAYELGSTAALRLFRRLEHPHGLTRQDFVLAPTLVIRDSSRPRNHSPANFVQSSSVR
ncbi:MAG: LacI family DNA-binding transcriptional regulator [Chloroflexota bacterium]